MHHRMKPMIVNSACDVQSGFLGCRAC
ncbi:unnamed protein product [Victoria cruziana]